MRVMLDDPITAPSFKTGTKARTPGTARQQDGQPSLCAAASPVAQFSAELDDLVQVDETHMNAKRLKGPPEPLVDASALLSSSDQECFASHELGDLVEPLHVVTATSKEDMPDDMTALETMVSEPSVPSPTVTTPGRNSLNGLMGLTPYVLNEIVKYVNVKALLELLVAKPSMMRPWLRSYAVSYFLSSPEPTADMLETLATGKMSRETKEVLLASMKKGLSLRRGSWSTVLRADFEKDGPRIFLSMAKLPASEPLREALLDGIFMKDMPPLDLGPIAKRYSSFKNTETCVGEHPQTPLIIRRFAMLGADMCRRNIDDLDAVVDVPPALAGLPGVPAHRVSLVNDTQQIMERVLQHSRELNKPDIRRIFSDSPRLALATRYYLDTVEFQIGLGLSVGRYEMDVGLELLRLLEPFRGADVEDYNRTPPPRNNTDNALFMRWQARIKQLMASQSTRENVNNYNPLAS